MQLVRTTIRLDKQLKKFADGKKELATCGVSMDRWTAMLDAAGVIYKYNPRHSETLPISRAPFKKKSRRIFAINQTLGQNLLLYKTFASGIFLVLL